MPEGKTYVLNSHHQSRNRHLRHDELLGKALETFSKPRTRDAAHLAAKPAMEEERDNVISQFIAGRIRLGRSVG